MTLKSFHSGVWWDTNTWKGNSAGIIGPGAKLSWIRHQDNAIPGRYHINSTTVKVAGRPGYVAESTPVDYVIKDGTRASLHLFKEGGVFYARGRVQEFSGHWRGGPDYIIEYRPMSGGRWRSEGEGTTDSADGSFRTDLFYSYSYYRIVIKPTMFSVGSVSDVVKMSAEAPVPDSRLGR